MGGTFFLEEPREFSFEGEGLGLRNNLRISRFFLASYKHMSMFRSRFTQISLIMGLIKWA